MSQRSKDWRDEIWTKFETLFDRSAPHATGLWSVPDGWRGTVEEMLARTADIVRADGIGRMTVTRLAQRDGQAEIAYVTESIRLRILIDAGIDRSSARLACTCGVCGAAAERYPRAEGTVARCPVHRPHGIDAISPPWPLIRIERAIRGGLSRIVRCRIYDRASDAFVDVDPESLGIPRSP